MEERDKKTELLVGLFLTVGILLMGLLILQFGSVRELFKDTYTITVPFADGTGIKEGTPVMFGGLRIGKVPRRPQHDATYTGVIITLEIYDTERIPSDAKFGIGTAGLLGDSYIEIRAVNPATRTYIQPDAVLTKESVASASGLGGLQDTAKDLSKKVDVAVEDIRAAIADLRVSLKKINEGALSDENISDLKDTFNHLNKVVTRLDEKTFDEQTSKDVKEAVASFKAAAKSVENAAAKLDPAMTKVSSAADKADTVMASADKAMKSLDDGAAALGKVATDLRRGEGLLPALIYDRNLKNEFSMLITNLRQRGVLWYRDKAGEVREEPPKPPLLKPKR